MAVNRWLAQEYLRTGGGGTVGSALHLLMPERELDRMQLSEVRSEYCTVGRDVNIDGYYAALRIDSADVINQGGVG